MFRFLTYKGISRISYTDYRFFPLTTANRKETGSGGLRGGFESVVGINVRTSLSGGYLTSFEGSSETCFDGLDDTNFVVDVKTNPVAEEAPVAG